MLEKEKLEKAREIAEKLKNLSYWKGRIRERKQAFLMLNRAFNDTFKRDIVLRFAIPKRFKEWQPSGMSQYVPPPIDAIVLSGRLSMVTFLHEYAHALGCNQKESQEFALGVFKSVFPDKWAKIDKSQKHFVIKEGSERPPTVIRIPLELLRRVRK